MTHNEVLTLIISGLSLLVAIVGLVVAAKANAKANALSREQNELTLRQAKASEHAVFVQRLFTVRQRLKKPLDELCRTAERILVDTSRLFDKYDKRENTTEYLRHVYYRVCKSVFSALCYQLVWQTSANLHWRLSSLYNIYDEEIESSKRLITALNFTMYYGPVLKPRGIFKLWHSKVPVEAEGLEDGLKEIYRGIDKTKKKQLVIEGYELCHKYFQLFEEFQPLLVISLDELKESLDLNKNQEFKLQESNALYREYTETIRKLEFLSECDMHMIKFRYEACNITSIAHLIYMGVILAIISEYHHWGADPAVISGIYAKQ